MNAQPGVVTLLPGEFGGDADGHLDAFRGAFLAETGDAAGMTRGTGFAPMPRSTSTPRHHC